MSDLHICDLSALPEGDPLFGLTPAPFVVKMDYRCTMPYRVFAGRFDYDQTTRWEIGRFSKRADADIFCAMHAAVAEANGVKFYEPRQLVGDPR